MKGLKGLSTWILGHRLPGISYCNTSKGSKIFNVEYFLKFLSFKILLIYLAMPGLGCGMYDIMPHVSCIIN